MGCFKIPGTRLPIFQQIPSDVHVFVGSSFFMPCEADEVTDIYQWVKEGTILSSDSNLVIQPGVGLSVQRASKTHSGTYICVARNELGMVNVSAVVSVTNAVITCDGQFSTSYCLIILIVFACMGIRLSQHASLNLETCGSMGSIYC